MLAMAEDDEYAPPPPTAGVAAPSSSSTAPSSSRSPGETFTPSAPSTSSASTGRAWRPKARFEVWRRRRRARGARLELVSSANEGVGFRNDVWNATALFEVKVAASGTDRVGEFTPRIWRTRRGRSCDGSVATPARCSLVAAEAARFAQSSSSLTTGEHGVGFPSAGVEAPSCSRRRRRRRARGRTFTPQGLRRRGVGGRRRRAWRWWRTLRRWRRLRGARRRRRVHGGISREYKRGLSDGRVINVWNVQRGWRTRSASGAPRRSEFTSSCWKGARTGILRRR